jgi:hypothetical protein
VILFAFDTAKGRTIDCAIRNVPMACVLVVLQVVVDVNMPRQENIENKGPRVSAMAILDCTDEFPISYEVVCVFDVGFVVCLTVLC